MIDLGDRVRHLITGYQGIVVARSKYFNGMTRFTLQREKLNKEGGVHENITFDEPELKLVKAQVVASPGRKAPPVSEIKLGDRIRDKVTKLEGIATAATMWLNGCLRIEMTHEKLDKAGKLKDTETLDAAYLEFVKRVAINPPKVIVTKFSNSKQYMSVPGGPESEPSRQKDPV